MKRNLTPAFKCWFCCWWLFTSDAILRSCSKESNKYQAFLRCSQIGGIAVIFKFSCTGIALEPNVGEVIESKNTQENSNFKSWRHKTFRE